MKKLYLTGYEQETINEFVKKLAKNRITTVIDIREKPLSRKNGFSKEILKNILSKKGINYYHIQELGCPENLRNQLKSNSDYLTFFQGYRKYLNRKPQLLHQTLDVIYSNGRSVLLCFEKEFEYCHRSIVASELLKCDPKLQIIPL